MGAAGAPQDSTEPVSQTALRFLRPVVGVDPADARLHRGETATQVTSAFGADAVTDGYDVFLAPGKGDANPAGLGLLAHELTHIASAGSADAEAPARQVEANVKSAAQQGMTTVAVSGGAVRPEPATSGVFSPGPAEFSTGRAATPTNFNGLPAPWEPLPDWLTTPPTDWPMATSDSPISAAAAAAPPSPPPVQTAEEDRDLPPPDSQSATANQDDFGHQHDSAQGVEPDLDALARHVYILLRRRLASESRRFR